MREPTHHEDGFTLVELLVAMTLSLIVLFATLQSLDVFSSEAAKQTRITDASDQVRSTMDRIVHDLRGASVITTATATDLVYTVPDPSGYRAERVCVQSSDLYGSRTMNAMPVGACSTGTKLADLKTTANTAFTYDNATAASVKNVGLTFSLDATGGGRSASSTLKASAAVRRSVATLPIGPGGVPITCPPAGPLVQIGAGIGLSEDFGPLTVSFTTNTGVTVTGGAVDPSTGSPPQILPLGITSVVAKITDSLGIVRALIPKNVECNYS